MAICGLYEEHVLRLRNQGTGARIREILEAQRNPLSKR
jgi:hypothetical protein